MLMPLQANESAPASQGHRETPSTWVLLGRHHGDNVQLIALAEALARPFITIRLSYRKRLSRLPGVVLGRSLLPLASPVDWPTPWPATVLASGRRVVPVARWIQAQAARHGRRTRLIHLGRPRAPLRWFDLVVTTAQYGLPEDRPNVVGNLLPLRFAQRCEGDADEQLRRLAPFASLPRPWTVALVGGNSRPYYFDVHSAERLGETLQHAQASGGSVIVLGSPRTSGECLDALEATLHGPHAVWRWSPDGNPYSALLRHADRFVVTGDSLAMLGDALASGRPVALFDLPKRLDLRARIAALSKSLAARSRLFAALHAALIDAGLVFSLRDLAECHRRLREAGMLAQPLRARVLAARERSLAIARIRTLLDSPAAALGTTDSQPVLRVNTGSNTAANLRTAYRLK